MNTENEDRLSKLREELEETKSGWCLQVERAETAERKLAEALTALAVLVTACDADKFWINDTALEPARAALAEAKGGAK